MRALAGVALLLAAFAPPAQAAGEAQRTARFLEALRGPWQGQASLTPRGPRPYDIAFGARDAACIEGSAEPGASTHLWRFCADGAALTLRFHSTFQGNTEPVLFTGSVGEDGRARLQAEDAGGTQVTVQPSPERATIEIRRHGKPHVRIELERKRGQTPVDK